MLGNLETCVDRIFWFYSFNPLKKITQWILSLSITKLKQFLNSSIFCHNLKNNWRSSISWNYEKLLARIPICFWFYSVKFKYSRLLYHENRNETSRPRSGFSFRGFSFLFTKILLYVFIYILLVNNTIIWYTC